MYNYLNRYIIGRTKTTERQQARINTVLSFAKNRLIQLLLHKFSSNFASFDLLPIRTDSDSDFLVFNNSLSNQMHVKNVFEVLCLIDAVFGIASVVRER